jgi:hypothetical protein
VGLHPALAVVDAGWKVYEVCNYDAKVALINSGISPVEDISDASSQDDSLGCAFNARSNFAEVSQASTIVICNAQCNLTRVIKFYSIAIENYQFCSTSC